MIRWRRCFWGASVVGVYGGAQCGLGTLGALAIWARLLHPMTEKQYADFEFLSVAVTFYSAGIGALLGAVTGALLALLYQWPLPTATHSDPPGAAAGRLG
jgi:hypothetical protein